MGVVGVCNVLQDPLAESFRIVLRNVGSELGV